MAFNESSNLGPTMNWATHALYVTQHHDSEYSTSHASNAYDPYDPVVDFAKYFNGENLQQEDLVLWGEYFLASFAHSFKADPSLRL